MQHITVCTWYHVTATSPTLIYRLFKKGKYGSRERERLILTAQLGDTIMKMLEYYD